MEWMKYILAMLFGGCLLLMFGRKGNGRDKWIMGFGAGTCLASMELTVEYMFGAPQWKMAVSGLKGLAFFSAIVLAGYVCGWIFAEQKAILDTEIVHPVRQWMEDYQESFAQLSRSFCMVPQLAGETGSRGERIMQERLAQSRLAAAGQLHEMSHAW